MRRPPYRTMLAAALAGAAWAPVAQAGDASPPPAVGAEAWTKIVGNTIAGTTPDGPYSQFFAPDGTMRNHDRDGTTGGRWTLRAPDLCITLADEEEECRGVEASERSGAFIDKDGIRYGFDILAGNPQKL